MTDSIARWMASSLTQSVHLHLHQQPHQQPQLQRQRRALRPQAAGVSMSRRQSPLRQPAACWVVQYTVYIPLIELFGVYLATATAGEVLFSVACVGLFASKITRKRFHETSWNFQRTPVHLLRSCRKMSGDICPKSRSLYRKMRCTVEWRHLTNIDETALHSLL